MDNSEIKLIIEKEALIIKKEESNFMLSSNDWNWIFDFRKPFLQGKTLSSFSSFFWDKYEEEFPFQVWWLELWAIPLISWIIMEWLKRGKNTNWFFIRKERKETWFWKQIEWSINDEKIIIVDDLFNSWKTIKKVNNAIIWEWKNIYKIFVFVNFGSEEWRNYLTDNNLQLDFEFTLGDFWLDSFWNSKYMIKKLNQLPIVFPKYQKLYEWKNANKFLSAMKSSPIKEWKKVYFWWEWWNFISLCSDTWNINWNFNINPIKKHKNILSSPIIIGEYILFWAYDWNFYCLDKNTWNVKWKSIDADWVGSSPVYSKKYNQVYIWLEYAWMKNKWSVAWINFDSWEKIWEAFYDDYVHCSPWYSEKVWLVICWGNDWKLLCLRWDTGKIVFEIGFDNPIKWWFSFSDDWKTAIFWCFDNKIYSLDLLTWKINWSFITNNVIYTTPLIIWNNILIGSLDKGFYHLNDKWELLKKIQTFWKIFSKPINIEENIIAFASNDSYIYFYDYHTRKVIYVIEHRERINNNLVYDRNHRHLYVYDFLNSIFKYDLNNYLG